MPPTGDELKERARATWAAGDYPDLARTVEAVSETVVDASEVAEGETLLDVATGDGNAALIAARRGARVTGIDLTPQLLDAARARAAEAGLTIDFAEGDAERLAFADESFDRVTSVFGAMFAPDQARTAEELLRVVRPGNPVAVAAWTPQGLNGQMFATVGSHMPAPPEGFVPPVLWGTEERIEEIFAGASSVRCTTMRAEGSVQADSIDDWIDYLERVLGPLVLAKATLEPEGRWEAVRSDLHAAYERFNEADDGTLRAAPEYLLSVIVR